MKKVKSKIHSNSTTIYITLLLLTFLIAISSVFKTRDLFLQNIERNGSIMSSLESLSAVIQVIQQYCFLPLLVFIALTFRKISVNETPFFSSLPTHLKIISILVFFSIAIPQWIGYIIYSIINNVFEFALFDNLVVTAFIISSIIFCIAQIFEYGTMLQNENDEIL